MSNWILRVHRHANTPVDISTDHPEYNGLYESLGPGEKLYTLPDAMRWVSYLMTPGDVVVTVAVDDRVPPICPGCDEECMGVWVDFGIGQYEYFGALGTDVQMAYVSSCCEAQLKEPEREPE